MRIFRWLKRWVWDIPREQSSIVKEQKSVKVEQLDVQSEQDSLMLDMLKHGGTDDNLARKKSLDGRRALLNGRIGNLNIRVGDLNELLFGGDRRGFGADGTYDGRVPGE